MAPTSRLLPALLAVFTACGFPRPPHLGDDAAPSIDAAGGDSSLPDDAPIDAPDLPLGTPMTRAYLFDFTTGIYRLDKDPTSGVLTVANPSPVMSGGAARGTSNKPGTHLYALSGLNATPRQIVDFVIAANGALSSNGVTSLEPCSPIWVTMHPAGSALAVGCSGGHIAIVPILGTGALGPAIVTTIGTDPASVAFTPDGSCLYAADLNAPPGGRTMIFQFNAATNALTPANTVAGPSVPWNVVVHPSGKYAYVGGSGVLQIYRIGQSCALTPIGTAAVGGTQQVVVDPYGRHVFVTGSEVYAFNVGANGELMAVAGSPFSVGGSTIDGAVIDPGMPNLLYLTARGFQGTRVATIAPNGALTFTSSVSVGNGGDQWLQLIP